MLKVMVVEDEESALDMMEILLTDIGGIEIQGKYQNPDQALEDVKQKSPQAIFMDIEMPGINGLELASKILEIAEGIKIVFVTAYSQYAIDAFELESVDYVLKPVTKARLAKAVERLKKWVEHDEGHEPEVKDVCLQVKCFERFEAIFKGQTEPLKWKTAKVKELFAFLIHHREQPLLRDEIIEILFPEEDFDKAKINFHTCMSYLRKCLSEGGLSAAISFTDNCYRLSSKNIACDFSRFNELIKSNKTLFESNIGLYQEAETLYQGDYLEKDDYLWAEEQRESLRVEYLKLLDQLADYFRNTGDLNTAEKYYLKMLEISPYSEDILFGLLQIKKNAGKRPEAIQLYQVFAERLMKDIGIKPSAKIKNLYASIIQ